ncbi:protein MEI2-like 2 [Citrus sinensis]|uniref:Protein MEI2-like 2 n=1 Tax=Citrus sinensis TaxID=2711 RepID=A0ACB8NIA6_CITSI|nr:protein MEI2-like 2 [Citrus sinensis]KAH9797589.1 protein MEI2-like 2 [Citrus sinensis]
MKQFFDHSSVNLNAMGLGRQSVDDISSGLSKVHHGVASDDPLEGVMNPAIGNSLPDDEDELLAGIMDDFDLRGLPSSLEDLEDYDIFGSGGGMELEGEPQESLSMSMSKISISDSASGNGLLHYSVPNGAGTVAGEHPYGEHPSRTLFVRNINSNVEDSELRALFEQYGDIRTLYTACKHRGFVMISYYDIRAARTAMRALQNKPLRRRKLDIHFSIPKDNPSDKDLNQGTLVVFNLDPSVSNEDLRQIFGAYGEVKEIRETPHKRHHKFIEFYDVRAAEAALKSLNRSDIAGKRIKLEPSRPGGARRNLMLQLNQELEQDESRILQHQVGSPITNSPPGNWVQFSSPIEHNPLQTISKSPNFRNMSPTTSNHMPGLASILHPQVSTLEKIAPIGKDQGRGSLMEHALTNTISANGASFQQSNSFSEPKIGLYRGTVSSFGPSPSNGSGVETLSGPQFLWGSPSRYSEHSSSPAWQTSSMGHPFSSNGKIHGLPYSGRQGSFLGSSQHHHVGSAPSGVPLERRFGFLPESPETSFMNPVAFCGMGIGQNDGSFMVNMGSRASVNPGITVPRNLSDNGSSFRVMSSPRLSPVFLGNGPYPGLTPANIEGLYERGRSRRIENNNGNQLDSKKQFQLELEKIRSGEDTRTTLMIKNIPNKYTSKMLLAAIDENHKGTYDFLYLPIDFKNKCNVGYAFINMLSPLHIIPFYEAFNGKKWEKFNSEKVASLAYARIQGRAALVAHFQNSSLMNEDKRCRPILFHSEGPEAGDQVTQEQLNSNSVNFQVCPSNGSHLRDASGSPIADDEGNKPENS